MTLFDRDTLLREITSFLADRDPRTLGEIQALVQREVEAAGARALARLGRRLSVSGDEWDFYPADPLARSIHHALAEILLASSSTLSGLEHLANNGSAPLVLLANHLSYSDANVLEVLLRRSGGGDFSDRLTVIAGPKVYSSLRRRFSSLCFGTIKTPQSSAVSSEDAVMNPREVARVARRCIDIAHDRLRAGDVLLVFAEGTRSRTCEMQPVLAAASRYLDLPGTRVLPVGITGSEAMFPIDDDRLHTVQVTVKIGQPLDADVLRAGAGGDRRLMMDAAGLAIADLLPAGYRGVYAGAAAQAPARELLSKSAA
jgi:1-acyl-sn-glycerol-3-phosphate acyltransferase